MSKLSKCLATLAALAAPAFQCLALDEPGVYFGKSHASPEYISSYLDFGSQGRFFSTSDYGFTPGKEKEYKLSGSDFGVSSWLGKGPLYVRGQGEKAALPKAKSQTNFGWLSGGGKSSFGLVFDKPFVPRWGAKDGKEGQFDRFPKQIPLFDQAVIYWGAMIPEKGTWSFSLEDASGAVRKIPFDNQKQLYPFDWTTINFPPTTVKGLKFDIEPGSGKENYAQVLSISLNLSVEKSIDNRAAVWQQDAYMAMYSSERAGTLAGVELFNLFIPIKAPTDFSKEKCTLTDLSPYVELGGKRIYAEQASYPVNVEKAGRVFTLSYPLKFSLPQGKAVEVKAKAVFTTDLQDTVSFEFQAGALPSGAKLGFEIFGRPDVFGSCPAGAIASSGCQTPAGVFSIDSKGTGKASLVQEGAGKPARIDVAASGAKLVASLSLPIGPLAGVQAATRNYKWRQSTAGIPDDGIAPFKMEDLELLESIDLSNPNDPHEIYDITNDPLILAWRKTGEATTPKNLGRLYHIKEPEKGRVPLAEVLGSKCRVINKLDSTYFRFNLQKVHFEPQVPYLIVVEHAFDKERRGEFHAVAMDKDNIKIVEANLWNAPNPFGGFDTGKGPYANKFKKESVLVFHPWRMSYAKTTVVSLCFSNTFGYNHLIKDIPEGLAIKNVSIYRIKQMPQLPDIAPLLPAGSKRHIAAGAENVSPYNLYEFPKLDGYDVVWANNQPAAQMLHGQACYSSRPSAGLRWHPGTLQGQIWLFEAAERMGLFAKIHDTALLDNGFEGTDYFSYAERGVNLAQSSAVPLSPTPGELEHLASAFNRSLSAIAKFKSFYGISVIVDYRTLFTKRNFDDFTKQTGVQIKSSPAPMENIRTMLGSDRKTAEAWMKWSSAKRHDYLKWLLELARKHKPEVCIYINDSSDTDTFRQAFESEGQITVWMAVLEKAKLKAIGADSYSNFLRLICHDPALYSGEDGFCFGMGKERGASLDDKNWISPYKLPDFAKIRDGFTGGLCISSSLYDESPKPLKNWICNFTRDQQSYRRDMLEALLHANARELFFDTYYNDPFRGRINEIRNFAVPFRLLPFAKPEAYEGKVSDSAKQAVARKHGSRYALMNAGDLPTEATLTLPPGKKALFDLSSGIRKQVPLQTNASGESFASLSMEQWSLKTLEIE